MKTYFKTKWVDGETPVNAANLNKLENAVQELSETSIGPSDLIVKEDGGLKKTVIEGAVVLELSDNFIKTSNDSITSINVISDSLEIKGEKDLSLYLAEETDHYTVMYGDKKIFPITQSSYVQVEGEDSMGLNEYLEKKFNDLYQYFSQETENLKSEITALKETVSELKTDLDYLESFIEDAGITTTTTTKDPNSTVIKPL